MCTYTTIGRFGCEPLGAVLEGGQQVDTMSGNLGTDLASDVRQLFGLTASGPLINALLS